jgi:hypothetical protein
LRVPIFVMSMAGKVRLSDSLRSRMISDVAGALELLEDHFVHAAAGVDQRGGDDGQRAAFLDVAGRAEEALRPLQRVGVDAAGQHLAGRRHHGVIGAAQTRDRIEQNHHVALVLDQALGFSITISATCTWREAGSSKVEDHLALHRALHVGDFLGTLVDQQHDQIALRGDWW